LPEILSIIHPDAGHSGVFRDAAALEGVAVEDWMPASGADPARDPLASYDGLLVLGGDENVGEEERYPYLGRENEVISHWLESGRPVMGVCLGAQMVAALLGGSVYRLDGNELGWLEYRHLDAAREDPVLGFAEPVTTGLLWHDYAFTAPAGATVLAENDACTQAFRIDETWALQPHPEVTEEILREWLGPDSRDPGDPARVAGKEELAAGMAAYLPAWNAYGTELFRRFARRCS
jgi:GMP synthase-like glutamine amidotransferase